MTVENKTVPITLDLLVGTVVEASEIIAEGLVTKFTFKKEGFGKNGVTPEELTACNETLEEARVVLFCVQEMLVGRYYENNGDIKKQLKDAKKVYKQCIYENEDADLLVDIPEEAFKTATDLAMALTDCVLFAIDCLGCAMSEERFAELENFNADDFDRERKVLVS